MAKPPAKKPSNIIKYGGKGLKALGALGTAWSAYDAVNEFRSAKTKADKLKSAANLMQSAHPVGWVTGMLLEPAMETKTYQKAQMKTLDWYDSVSPAKKLNDLALDAKAKAGAAAAAKRRAAMAKTSPKGKK